MARDNVRHDRNAELQFRREAEEMRIVKTNTVTYTEGYTYGKERGPAVRRTNVDYEHVRMPVFVPRPQIEEFDALVVVNDKMEYYV